MNYAELKIELATDELSRGYDTMTDLEVATSLNTVNRTVPRASMTSSEVLNAVDVLEYDQLSSANQNRFWQLMAIGVLNPFGVEADLMQDLFGPSDTIDALAAARHRPASRAEEIGLGEVVTPTHVAKARA